MSLGASIISLKELFKKGVFKPASVQRSYQWKAQECGTLITDFERAWRASDLLVPVTVTESHSMPIEHYYLGGFVLLQSHAGEFEVFDGLQRMTTLTVLFSVLRDLLEEFDSEKSNELNDLVFAKTGAARLQTGRDDQTLPNLIQRRSEAIRTRRNLSANTLRATLLGAAYVFRTALAKFSPDELVSFALFIMERVKVTSLSVPDARLARQIFITTNNRGVPLNEADVLRSQINSIPYRQDVADQVLKVWKDVSNRFDDNEDYEDFLFAIDFITRRRGRSAEGLSQLGEYLGSKLNDAQILEWLVSYEQLAEAWLWLRSVKFNPGHKDVSKRVIGCLFVFEWSEWKPVALIFARDLLEAWKNGEKRRVRTLRSRFDDFAKICLSLTLANISRTERTHLMLNALTDIRGGRNPHNNALNVTQELKEQIRATLLGPVGIDQNVVETFRWLEVMQSKTPNMSVYEARIERVLPISDTSSGDWGAVFSDPEKRWQSVNQWGNFVLRANSQVQDIESAADFRLWKKRAAEDANRTQTVKEVLKYGNWTPDTIAKRTEKIQAAIEASLLNQ